MTCWPFAWFSNRRRAQEDRIFAVLQDGELSSYEIGQRTKLTPGVLYLTLYRLEDAGYLESRWGVATPERVGHRPRLYRLPVVE